MANVCSWSLTEADPCPPMSNVTTLISYQRSPGTTTGATDRDSVLDRIKFTNLQAFLIKYSICVISVFFSGNRWAQIACLLISLLQHHLHLYVLPLVYLYV